MKSEEDIAADLEATPEGCVIDRGKVFEDQTNIEEIADDSGGI